MNLKDHTNIFQALASSRNNSTSQETGLFLMLQLFRWEEGYFFRPYGCSRNILWTHLHTKELIIVVPETKIPFIFCYNVINIQVRLTDYETVKWWNCTCSCRMSRWCQLWIKKNVFIGNVTNKCYITLNPKLYQRHLCLVELLVTMKMFPIPVKVTLVSNLLLYIMCK